MSEAEDQAIATLKYCAASDASALNLYEVFEAFSILERPDLRSDRYTHVIEKLASKIQARHKQFILAGAKNDSGTRLAAMRDVLIRGEGFSALGDDDGDLAFQLDIASALDRRGAHPAMLAVIFMIAADQCGWVVDMLSVPKTYILRMNGPDMPLIFNPAQECALLQAHDIRALIKENVGGSAELSAAYMQPMSRFDVVMTVENLIKLHRIATEDYDAALRTVAAMQALAPQEYRLLLDAGVLYARTRQTQAAIFALDHYISKTPDPRSRAEAQALLDDLRLIEAQGE